MSQEKLNFLRAAARNKLLNFCQIIDHKFEAHFFHEIIAEKLEHALDAIVNKKKARIILTVPPRHGKTQLTSINFSAWALGKHPELQFILSTYGAELSERIGMKTRDVIDSEQYQGIFPGISLRPDQKAKSKWQTNKGGSFTAVGIGGAITGIGGDIILVDDPHKDRAEAESELQRENVWQYFNSTLYSRLEGFGAVVLIMQRWHTDDLVGRLLEESERLKAAGQPYDEWEVINFPAIAEEDEYHNSQLVRKKGEALWPSKFPLDVLENIAAKDVYNWSSQYLQDPILSVNQEFRKEMFKHYEEEHLVNRYLRYTTTVDPAGYKKNSDDNVILTVGKEVNGENWYVVEITNGKMSPGEVIDAVFAHQARFKSDVYVEGVAYQSTLKWHIEERMRKQHVYFPIYEIRSRGAKEDRIRGLLPLYRLGVLWHRPHYVNLERQLLQFPRGKNDDIADALAMQLESVQNSGYQVKQFRKKHISPSTRRR